MIKETAESQYQSMKEKYPDCILFFRMGDFYEVFDNDAVQMSKVLGLTLTSRDRGENKRHMAGMPHHSLQNYLGKAVEAGYKIAIAEQMADPKTVKGIVPREVIRIVTPVNLIDEKNLNGTDSNFVMAVNKYKNQFVFAWADLSTGEFNCLVSNSLSKIYSINPRELITTEELKPLINYDRRKIRIVDDYSFDLNLNLNRLCDHFKVLNLKGFGLSDTDLVISPSGVIIDYLKSIQKTDLSNLCKITVITDSEFMPINSNLINTLEISKLIPILDNLQTQMGKRLLRHWLQNPLIDQHLIQKRLDSYEQFTNHTEINKHLSEMNDLERLTSKIGLSTITPKDLCAIKKTLLESIDLQSILSKVGENNNETITSFLSSPLNTLSVLFECISPNAPYNLIDGNVFNTGYNSELDNLRFLKTNSTLWLENFEKQEIEKTGISNLKVRFNNVFGYYIEISNSNINKVPATYIRKQTLVNGERYINEELKIQEEIILNIDSKIISLEKQLYTNYIGSLIPYIPKLQELSKIIAHIDLYTALNIKFKELKYVKAEFSPTEFSIIKSRHPVVESVVETYTPNDLYFNDHYFKLITGPNMSGKSTYIRQIAVIQYLAQCGFFVPASVAKINIVDQIFVRIGASDNLTSGESTFMVEMNEVANILNNATSKSLIILDEVGRGTSTYDGVAIAYGVCSFILDVIKAKTIFATHFHELTDLELHSKFFKNFTIKVINEGESIFLTHQIIEGKSGRSFGIHCASLAGVPKAVILSAEKKLKDLEKNNQQLRLF